MIPYEYQFFLNKTPSHGRDRAMPAITRRKFERRLSPLQLNKHLKITHDERFIDKLLIVNLLSQIPFHAHFHIHSKLALRRMTLDDIIDTLANYSQLQSDITIKIRRLSPAYQLTLAYCLYYRSRNKISQLIAAD